MTFNIHITRIGEQSPSGQAAKLTKTRTVPTTQSQIQPVLSLVNVPAANRMKKYPVRIFELETPA